MNKSYLVSSLVLLTCLCAGWARGGELPSPAATEQATETSTEKELLVFYEEQDLYTATKRATSLRKAPAIATIINADEIRNMGARTLLDVLKLVPGFGISINEWGTYMIEVRGIRTSLSEKILVMIDGHPLNKNIYGSALIYNLADMLPVENIKQVEVVRGPGSALYGNSAFVATINIITRDAEEIDGVEAKGGAGSFDTYKANLVGGKALADNLNVSASVDHYRTRGPKLTVEADALTGTPFSMAPGTPDLSFSQTDAFLKIGYGDFSFRSHYFRKEQGFFIGLASALTDSEHSTIDTYWGEAAYNLHLTDHISSNIKFHYDYYDQSGLSKIYPNGFAGAFPAGVIGNPQAKDRAIGGEYQVDWDVTKGSHLIAGASYEVMQQYAVRQFANFDPLTFADLGSVQQVANWNRDVTRQTWAIYGQGEWRIQERVNLTAGARYDHYSDFGGTVNPRGGLVWNFLDNADFKLLYGEAFRAPNFVELYDINNPVVIGNPNLKPERITTYEAALAYRLNRLLAGDVNYFYSTIRDLIIFDTSTTPAHFVNAGRSRTQGVEVGLNGAFDDNLYWKLTYAYQDPRDAITGQRLPYVPSQRATASINYAPVKYLNLHSDLLWTGPRPRGEGDARPEMPSYTTVDLSVTLKNFLRTLEIQATVRNLFDERFRDPDTSGAQQKVPGDFPREGISAFVTASYKF